MSHGKANSVFGLLFLAAFMLYGFVLIYLRDFAPGKEVWIVGCSTGKHFVSRLAHVHGNLFAFLNIMIGYLLLRLPLAGRRAKWISWLGLAGMLTPVGILSEVVFGAPPALVLFRWHFNGRLHSLACGRSGWSRPWVYPKTGVGRRLGLATTV